MAIVKQMYIHFILFTKKHTCLYNEICTQKLDKWLIHIIQTYDGSVQVCEGDF